MISFICKSKPLSVNARRTHRFQEELRQAFLVSCGNEKPAEGPLYGAVYYFHTQPRSLDADNLSKPVWDALKGLSYRDDSHIQLRHAGIANLREIEWTSFDLSNVSARVANDLISSLGSEAHVVYVEVGPLTEKMYEFGRDRARTKNQ